MDLKTIGVIVGLTIPFMLLTIFAIINAAQKDFGSTGKKALWLLVAAIPFVGFIIYFLFGFRYGKKPG
jgi:hypothetical protein